MNEHSTLGYIRQLKEASAAALQTILGEAEMKRRGPDKIPHFSPTVAEAMVGKTLTAIRVAEKDGRLPSPSMTQTGRRAGYTLGEINHMRDVFGTRPRRSDTDKPAIISCSNFKGGVSKTTTAAHLGQYHARKGYRVLLVDCDPQASLTSLFGKVPDRDVDDDHTLAPFLRELDRPDLSYAVQETHWDGLHLIPANLRLYMIEYELAARMSDPSGQILNRLAQGIQSIAQNYDVIIIDPPPALGAISLSVIRAANALLIPVPPTVLDFSSTAAFFSMLEETISTLVEYGYPVDLNWIKIVLSRVDDNKSIQKEIAAGMRDIYGDTVLRAVMRDSAEIDNASARMMTVYELDRPITKKEVHERARKHLDAVCSEVEIEIRRTWPSHTRALQNEALV